MSWVCEYYQPLVWEDTQIMKPPSYKHFKGTHLSWSVSCPVITSQRSSVYQARLSLIFWWVGETIEVCDMCCLLQVTRELVQFHDNKCSVSGAAHLLRTHIRHYKLRVLCLNVHWNERIRMIKSIIITIAPKYSRKRSLVGCHWHSYLCCAAVTVTIQTEIISR